MCNLHDVTWGTKGDNGAAKDLGGAKKVKDANGKELMEVELPTAREDVDSLWTASRNALRYKPVEEKEHRDAATKQADHDRNSRTNVVLTWVGTTQPGQSHKASMWKSAVGHISPVTGPPPASHRGVGIFHLGLDM